MVKTAKTNPTAFFATCARLIGPEVKLTIEQQLPGNLSPADWNLMIQILDDVKSAIPDAHTRAAGEVLEFVLGAILPLSKTIAMPYSFSKGITDAAKTARALVVQNSSAAQY